MSDKKVLSIIGHPIFAVAAIALTTAVGSKLLMDAVDTHSEYIAATLEMGSVTCENPIIGQTLNFDAAPFSTSRPGKDESVTIMDAYRIDTGLKVDVDGEIPVRMVGRLNTGRTVVGYLTLNSCPAAALLSKEPA